MNWPRVALAAGAGLAAFLIVAGAFYGAIALSLNLTPMSGGNPPSLGQLVLWYVVLPALVALGGALPARALGIAWTRALPSALVAHVVGAYVAFGLLRPQLRLHDERRYDAVAFVVGAALALLLAMALDRSPRLALLAVAGVAVATLLLAIGGPGRGFYAVPLAWIGGAAAAAVAWPPGRLP